MTASTMDKWITFDVALTFMLLSFIFRMAQAPPLVWIFLTLGILVFIGVLARTLWKGIRYARSSLHTKK